MEMKFSSTSGGEEVMREVVVDVDVDSIGDDSIGDDAIGNAIDNSTSTTAKGSRSSESKEEDILRVPDSEVDKQLALGQEIERRYRIVAHGDPMNRSQRLAFVKFVFLNVSTLQYGQQRFAQMAFELLSQLVDVHYAPAQFYMGCLLLTGVPGFARRSPDHVRAFALFHFAAHGGHVDAMYHTALCYRFGRGTGAVDAPRAIKWLKRAAAHEHPGALYTLSQTGGRRNLGLKLSPVRSNSLLERAGAKSDRRYNKAPFRLAQHYKREGEDATSLHWLERGQELGQRDCIAALGFLHLTEREKFNIDIAESYFTTAKELGSAGACFGLSLVHLVKGDIHAAFVDAMEASTRGDYRGDYVVGYLGLKYHPENRANLLFTSQTGREKGIVSTERGYEEYNNTTNASSSSNEEEDVDSSVLLSREPSPIPMDLLSSMDGIVSSVPEKRVEINLPNPIDYVERALVSGGDPYADRFLHSVTSSYAPGVASVVGGKHVLVNPLCRRDINVLEDEVDWDEMAALTTGEEILLKDAERNFSFTDHVI